MTRYRIEGYVTLFQEWAITVDAENEHDAATKALAEVRSDSGDVEWGSSTDAELQCGTELSSITPGPWYRAQEIGASGWFWGSPVAPRGPFESQEEALEDAEASGWM